MKENIFIHPIKNMYTEKMFSFIQLKKIGSYLYFIT